MMIKRRIDEKDLLKMLGIPSFRHMTKDKLASFVSALPDIDPDVAKKALEQFPDLSAAITEIVGHYTEIVSECVAGSDADTHLCLEACASVIDSIQHELESEVLTFEQRETLIGQSVGLAQTMRAIDADGKRFRTRIICASSIALGLVAAALVSVLGGKTDLSLPGLCQVARRA